MERIRIPASVLILVIHLCFFFREWTEGVMTSRARSTSVLPFAVSTEDFGERMRDGDHGPVAAKSRGAARAKGWVFLGIGAGTGIVSGLLQLRLLRYGALAPDQWPLYWFSFGLLGISLSSIGGFAARAIWGRRSRSYTAALLLPLLAFLVLLPNNLRDLPDVYLLVTDATQASHLSVYGYERETSPFLEELAGEAVVFENMVSQGTHTIVSTPAILASCYPSDHGIVGYTNVLSEDKSLLSEYLHGAGYTTFAYATNPHLSPRNGYSQGFDVYQHDPNWAHTPAGDVNARYLAWVDEQQKGPVFSFLFYIDPHNPYRPPLAYQTLFDPEWQGEPVSDWKHEWGKPKPKMLFNLIAQYDGAIAYWDAELGKMMGELKKRGLFENSLFVYTADHGEEFWEHGFWGHNKTLYEASIHVPLIISFPVPIRFPPLRRTSGRVQEVVSSVDIVPTILEFLRLEPDEGVRGRSALPLVFGGEEGPERIAYCEEILEQYGPYDIRGIRTRTHKYIKLINFEGNRGREDLFFDLVSDPEEQRNLLHERPEEAEIYRKTLELRMAEISTIAPPVPVTVPLEDAARKRLKDLGYLK